MNTTEATIDTAQFVTETLVSDTRVFEVVKRTPFGMTLRPTRDTGVQRTDENCDKGAHGLAVVWFEQEPNPDAGEFTLRRRNDGTFRTHRTAHAIRPVTGTPERRRDFRN